MNTTNLAVLGLGSRSTAYYLSELNKKYHQLKGGYSTCPLLLLNANFNYINSLLPYTSVELDNAVDFYLKEIEKQAIENILIPNITLHETIDRLEIAKNILHPVHLSIEKVKENGWNRVILFGSLFSMKSDYIKEQFRAKNIEILLPTEEDMLFIDEVRKAIYTESETKDLIAQYHLLIHKYSKENPVVLSCTELSILKSKRNKNLLDMADVQMEEAVELILE